MTELIQKILSKLPKHTLVILVMFLTGALAKYWYTDYKEGQIELQSKMIEQLESIKSLQNELSDEVAQSNSDTDLKFREITNQLIRIGGRQEIVIKALPEIKTQIEQYDNIYNRIRESQRGDEGMRPMDPKKSELYADVDSVKKKLNEKL